jgi:long-chain acyl-CoA synthetase
MPVEERFTIAGILRTHASERPHAEMLIAGSERRTWLEEYQRACQVSHALEGDGVGRGDRIAFLDKNDLAYFDVLFGGAFIGAVNVAVNWRLASPEIAAVIDDCRASVLVIHPDYLGALASMESGLPHVRRIVVLDEGGAVEAADERALG